MTSWAAGRKPQRQAAHLKSITIIINYHHHHNFTDFYQHDNHHHIQCSFPNSHKNQFWKALDGKDWSWKRKLRHGDQRSPPCSLTPLHSPLAPLLPSGRFPFLNYFQIETTFDKAADFSLCAQKCHIGIFWYVVIFQCFVAGRRFHRPTWGHSTSQQDTVRNHLNKNKIQAKSQPYMNQVRQYKKHFLRKIFVNCYAAADLRIRRSTTLAGGRQEQEQWRRSRSKKYQTKQLIFILSDQWKY